MGRTENPMVLSRHRSAFSLVELLVVIAVAALLIGILVPSIGAARESARTAACSSNLDQLQAGWISVVTVENTGKIPVTKQDKDNPGTFYVEALGWAFAEDTIQWEEDTYDFGCPTVHAEYDQITYGTSVRYGYPINTWWKGDPDVLNGNKPWAAIESPSTYPWFTDGQVYEFGGGYSIAARLPFKYLGAPDWGVGANHKNASRANVAYGDGSVRSEPIAEIRKGLIGKDNYPWLENR